jgi:hypothetical protein
MKTECTPYTLPFDHRKLLRAYVGKDEVFFCCHELSDAAYIITNRYCISRTTGSGALRLAPLADITGYKRIDAEAKLSFVFTSYGQPVWSITFDKDYEAVMIRRFEEALKKVFGEPGTQRRN